MKGTQNRVRFQLKYMNSSSIFKYRISAVAICVAALTTSVWAGPSTPGTVGSSSKNGAVVDGQSKREIAIVYPYDEIIQGKSGWVDTSYVVDYVGRPLFTTVAGASDQAFAKAALAMVEANEFAPFKKNNRAVMTSSGQRINFSGEASFDTSAKRVLAELRKPQPAICPVSELDERPKAVRQANAVYPRALKDDGLTGQAEIEFVISSEGKVLFPRIVSASQEDFGWAAAIAVAQWKFQPPTKNGQKVDARMTVPVLFDARQLAAAD